MKFYGLIVYGGMMTFMAFARYYNDPFTYGLLSTVPLTLGLMSLKGFFDEAQNRCSVTK